MKHMRKCKKRERNKDTMVRAIGSHNVEKIKSTNKRKVTRKNDVIDLKTRKRLFMIHVLCFIDFCKLIVS